MYIEMSEVSVVIAQRWGDSEKLSVNLLVGMPPIHCSQENA